MGNIENWFSVGKKAAIGFCFLVIGILFSLFGPTEGAFGSLEFLFYMLGMLSFVNILFSKINKFSINYIFYLVANSVMASIVISILAASFEWKAGTMMGMMGLIFLLLWCVQACIIRGNEIVKRLVISFFCTLCSSFCMMAAFVLVAILRMGKG